MSTDPSSNAPGSQPRHNVGLRNCSRYICSHDSEGKSIFVDSPELLYVEAPGAGYVARSYAINSIPAPLGNNEDLKDYLSTDINKPTSHTNRPLTIGGGANLVTVNFAPGGLSQMHRTVSIDFSICIEGEIEMELDNGDKRELKAGDTIIQRATMHRWRNMSNTQPARLIAVLIDSEKFHVGGLPIEEVHVKGSGAKGPDGSRL